MEPPGSPNRVDHPAVGVHAPAASTGDNAMSKTIWMYRWNDGTHQHGATPRARVAYLLRAARSRRSLTGERTTRHRDGYRIGRLALIRC